MTHFTVFISHAGEDKTTIAIPLRDRLLSQGITAFVDEADMPIGTPAEEAMINAMNTAEIAVIVLSPEFVARKWPMKELMAFLKRREEGNTNGRGVPVILPFFYRLKVTELHNEPRFDRFDEDGNSIYLRSQFLQRMEKGEPEANIVRIKAALLSVHGFMGVRNDLEASNDNSMLMKARRDFLIGRLCRGIRSSISTDAQVLRRQVRIKRKRREQFQPHFDPPLDTSKLVLDFTITGENGDPCTQEGGLLKIILDQSTSRCRTIAIQGMAGVGKTSLLLGLCTLEAARSRFRDGIYCVSLDLKGTQSRLVTELSKAVENSGGKEKANEMRKKKDFREVMRCLRSWFAGKRCLFVFDNVLETADIRSSTIQHLLKLQECGQGSKTLFATRNLVIASRADRIFGLEPREMFDCQAREILIRYSGIAADANNLAEGAAIMEILKRCCGLPLFLAVAGKAIRTLSLRKSAKIGQAYQAYAFTLDADTGSLMNTDVDSYERLQTALSISMTLLQERINSLQFRVPSTAVEMHRRLSVIEKREKVPMSMLQHLWELSDEAECAIVAREFEQIALVDMEMSEDHDPKYKEVLRLHDSLHLFAVTEAKRFNNPRVGHEAVLNGYGEALETSGGCRAWWSPSLAPDGYIHENLCRHLLECGRYEEIIELLLHPQWTFRSFTICGLLQVEHDFGLCLSRLCNRRMSETETDFQVEEDTAKSLELVSVALGSASMIIGKNLSELSFQLHGRLKGYSRRFEQVGKYLERMDETPSKPSMRSINCFMEEPSLANVRVVSVGVRISCMVTFGDGKRVACGCEDGRVVILDAMQSKVEFWWAAHQGRVQTIAIGGNGTRLISGSADATVKVWEIDSYRCLATFCGHEHFAISLAVMADGISVVSVCEDGPVQVWNMHNASLLSGSIRNEKGLIMCVAALPDGMHILSGGKDGTLRMWNASTGNQVGSEFVGHESWVNCVHVSPDGRQVISGSIDGTVRTWDIDTHKQIGKYLDASNEGFSIVDCVALSESGKCIVSGSCEGLIVWDTETEERLWHSFGVHSREITGVSFLDGEDSIVSCSNNGDIRVWDVRQHNFEGEPRSQKHEAAVKCVCFTRDGKRIITGSRDMTLRIWDAESGMQLGSPLRGLRNWVRSIAVTPDQRWIVSVSDDDATVCFWNMTSHELVHRFTGHTSWICDVAITPRGDRAITGSWDRTVRVWNLENMDGSHVVLQGHTDAVWSVFVSEDGLRIISVEEHRILVWELETKRCVTILMRGEAWKLSRREILNLVGETTVHDRTQLSVPLQGSVIKYGEGMRRRVIATLPERVWSWDMSLDMKTTCVGLEDGTVAILLLQE